MNKLQQDVIELFEDLLEKQGFSRIHGHILARIYLKDIPMTQKDLEKESHFSRSSINKAVNTLQSLGYVRKRQRGEGKQLDYYIEGGLKEILLGGVREYIVYFEKIYLRFSKLFASKSKIEGLPLKKIKDFIEHLPQIRDLLNNALLKIDELDLVFK